MKDLLGMDKMGETEFKNRLLSGVIVECDRVDASCVTCRIKNGFTAGLWFGKVNGILIIKDKVRV